MLRHIKGYPQNPEVMKYIFLLLLFASLPGFSQDKLVPLDKDLSTVTYPFDVKFHAFKSQGQEMRMAYMDVAPPMTNGKMVLLLHGKNFNGAY